MTGFLEPPQKGRFLSRFFLSLVERALGKTLVAQRILLWYPKSFWGSGLLEALVAHDVPEVPQRLLGLIRLLVSFRVSCAFCIDMNARDYGKMGITEEEILSLQTYEGWLALNSFTEKEKSALAYVEGSCLTPVEYRPEVVADLKRYFDEKGFVIIATTAAQVNFWTRLIQGLGVPPAGFSKDCRLLGLDEAQIRVKGIKR